MPTLITIALTSSIYSGASLLTEPVLTDARAVATEAEQETRYIRSSVAITKSSYTAPLLPTAASKPRAKASQAFNEVQEQTIVDEQSFRYMSTQLRSDVCDLSAYKQLSAFLPNRLDISNSDGSHFNIDTDVQCQRYGPYNRHFICETQQLTRSTDVPFLGQVTLGVNNTTSGKILNEHALEVQFDMTVQDCTGSRAGCFAVEIGLDFPCPVSIKTLAVY